ncbi:hypothetical protein JGI3_02202 [Candidatus Kryptobacter tengchongensis]|nr:hypothetical protein JGI3_02202 [Candidatus Kryptobacter tengchongensis]
MIERKPAVAGIFYPESPEKLQMAVRELVSKSHETKKAIAAILPHAGYIYSGKIAGKTISSISVPERIIILCPNHTGYGEVVSLFPPGSWIFPGFSVKIDEEINSFLSNFEIFQMDTGAHYKEHSAEVLIPLLHFINPKIKINVICIRTLRRESLKVIAEALKEVYKKYEDILIVASSDMNHYEEDDVSRKKDKAAIEKIKEINPDGFLDICYNMNISVCGAAPIYSLLSFLKGIKVKNSEVLAYGNSGEVNGDLSSVVGYAGIIFF